MGVDHRTWTRCVQFTYEYNQATCVYILTQACPKGAHVCDMHDTCVAVKLWVNCTVYSGGLFICLAW